MHTFLTPTFRTWLYGIAIALIPVAVSSGWIEPPMAGLLIPLVVAILNPTRPDNQDVEDGAL